MTTGVRPDLPTSFPHGCKARREHDPYAGRAPRDTAPRTPQGRAPVASGRQGRVADADGHDAGAGGEIDRIGAALDGAADGTGSCRHRRAAGIGKTRLVDDARALAQLRGFGRLLATGEEPEREMPWGVVRQFVERSILRSRGEEREKILAGPAGAALRALDRAPGTRAATTPRWRGPCTRCGGSRRTSPPSARC